MQFLVCVELVLSGIYQRNEVVDVACTRKVDRLSKKFQKFTSSVTTS